MRRHTHSLLLGVALAVTGAWPAAGQRRRVRPPEDYTRFNVAYDGRFTFVRIRYAPAPGGRGFYGVPGWAHDYPRAERNFEQILREVTRIDPYMGGSNVLMLDDPELFKYPVAYLSEPGYWVLSEAEAEGLRAYLLKGGFLIVDDFTGYDWFQFADQMQRVLPDHRLVELDASHPIFDAFFHIETLDTFVHPYFAVTPEFRGIFEENDPTKRLMVIVNYNNDIGDYWEWSDVGFLPIDLSNEAYKLGVNYVVYGMMH